MTTTCPSCQAPVQPRDTRCPHCGMRLTGYPSGGLPGTIVIPGSHAASILYKIISPSGPWPGGNRMPQRTHGRCVLHKGSQRRGSGDM